MSKTLIEFWRMIRGQYGVALAGIVIVAILVIAFYLGVNPSAVVDWMGR